ncbi:MAG: hypothetical protein AB4426_07030 [Xenococcaceae cyanobacterium]
MSDRTMKERYELSGQEALEACDLAIAINPNDAGAWQERGIVLVLIK